jgi:putative transposase
VSRYRCVDTQKAAGFPVNAACEFAGVSTSAYYAWAARRDVPSQRELDDAALLEVIRKVHAASDGTYGEPRMTAELWSLGHQVNHKRVERLMREAGLEGHRPKGRRSLTKADEKAAPAPDLVGRLFNPDQPDHIWCGDITFVRTDEGWLYLSTVIDLASRRLLGWSMRDRHDADLVVNAVEAAVATRGRARMPDTIFHSDRGSEYTSKAFRDACERLGIRQSMGRTGSCLDNAVAESFFATLKVELIDRYRWRTRAEARTAIFAWIHRYNARRRHSTLGLIAPLEWERRHAPTASIPSPMAA